MIAVGIPRLTNKQTVQQKMQLATSVQREATGELCVNFPVNLGEEEEDGN